MTTIEWVKGPDGSDGISWNALRAVREIERNGQIITVSANHCEHVNEACRFCYADRMNPRLGGLPFKPGHRKDYRFLVDHEKLISPLKRKKATRYFVESMSDAFGDWWPEDFIDKLYAVMALTPRHTYINLSKRPERRRKYLQDEGTYRRIQSERAMLPGGAWEGGMGGPEPFDWPLPNIIEGTSVSNQTEADEFIPILQETLAACRVVSIEPLLGPIDLTAIKRTQAEGFMRPLDGRFNKLDWVIVGGESGPNARPMHPQWARDIRDQCAAAGVPFFFKQWGAWSPDKAGKNFREVQPGKTLQRPQDRCIEIMSNAGKTLAGRLLDGREHNEFPQMKAKMESPA